MIEIVYPLALCREFTKDKRICNHIADSVTAGMSGLGVGVPCEWRVLSVRKVI